MLNVLIEELYGPNQQAHSELSDMVIKNFEEKNIPKGKKKSKK